MQVSATTNEIDTDIVSFVIPKSQVAMLAKKGDTLIDQGRKSYLINALMLSDHNSLDHGIFKLTANGGTKSPYLLQPSLPTSYAKE